MLPLPALEGSKSKNLGLRPSANELRRSPARSWYSRARETPKPAQPPGRCARTGILKPLTVTPHNQALYEAGKQMLVDSISVGREFCKFMVGVSTGAIPLYLALLQFALPKDYRPEWWWKGFAAILPGAGFLAAAATFALGVFPRTESFSLDVVEQIERARGAVIRRRGHFSTIGFALFGAAALAGIVVTVAALRVKAPSAPNKPFKVQIVKRGS